MYVVQVLRKLVGMEQSNDLVIHVAMDNALILRYSSRKKNVGFFPMHCNPFIRSYWPNSFQLPILNMFIHIYIHI